MKQRWIFFLKISNTRFLKPKIFFSTGKKIQIYQFLEVLGFYLTFLFLLFPFYFFSFLFFFILFFFPFFISLRSRKRIQEFGKRLKIGKKRIFFIDFSLSVDVLRKAFLSASNGDNDKSLEDYYEFSLICRQTIKKNQNLMFRSILICHLHYSLKYSVVQGTYVLQSSRRDTQTCKHLQFIDVIDIFKG